MGLQGEYFIAPGPASETLNQGLLADKAFGRVLTPEKQWSERQELNLRRLGPKPSALARLSYAPTVEELKYPTSGATRNLKLLISTSVRVRNE